MSRLEKEMERYFVIEWKDTGEFINDWDTYSCPVPKVANTTADIEKAKRFSETNGLETIKFLREYRKEDATMLEVKKLMRVEVK